MTDPKQETFDALYDKCKNAIDKYELIPPTIRKVKINYSGGKDSSVLADLLCAYRERERAELTLELAMLPIPKWCYQPDDPERSQLVADALDFWRDRGLVVTTVPLPPSMTEGILETGYGSNIPCWYCSWLFKPWGLMRASFSEDPNTTVSATGFTLDDVIGWALAMVFLGAGRTDWQTIREERPDLFPNLVLSASRLYPRVNMRPVGLVRPIIDLNEDEIRPLVAERGYPLIPEDCGDIRDSSNFKDSPRREIAAAVSAARKSGAMGPAFSTYEMAIDFFTSLGIIPPVEVVEARAKIFWEEQIGGDVEKWDRSYLDRISSTADGD